MRQDASQIEKNLAAFVRTAQVSFASGQSSMVITGLLGYTLASAANDGSGVPFQPYGSGNATGVITTYPYNRTKVYDATTEAFVADADGNTIFARVVENAGVYSITLFVKVAGAEMLYNATGNLTVLLDIPYVFSFDSLPFHAFLYDDDWFSSLVSSKAVEITITVGLAGAPSVGDRSFVLADCNGNVLTYRKLDLYREGRLIWPDKHYTYNEATGLITLSKKLNAETLIAKAWLKALWTLCNIGDSVVGDAVLINATDALLINSAGDRLLLGSGAAPSNPANYFTINGTDALLINSNGDKLLL